MESDVSTVGLLAGEAELRPGPVLMISCILTQIPGSHRQELISQYAHLFNSHVFVFAFLMCVCCGMDGRSSAADAH